MKISVIVPFCNETDYLAEALKSLSEQSFKDFETIVVYNGENEETFSKAQEMATEYDAKLISFADKKGVAAARNEGIRQASGEYLFFLDCDDFLEDDTLKRLAEQVVENAKDVVRGEVRYTWYGKKVDFLNELELSQRNAELTKKKNSYKNISALGNLYRREFVLSQVGMFDEDYIYFSDVTFIDRAIRLAKSVADVDAIYWKREHNDPIQLPSLSQRKDKFVRITEATKSFVETFEHSNTYEELFEKYYLNVIRNFYDKEPEEAKRQEIHALVQPVLKKMSLTDKESRYGSSHTVNQIRKRDKRKRNIKRAIQVICKRSELKRFLYFHVFSKMKVKENIVVYESFFARYYSDSPKYIYEYLAKNYKGKFKHVWVLNKKEKLPYDGICIKKYSFRFFYYMARAKYFVYNGRQPVYMKTRENQVFLETWHGTPLKRLVFDMDEITSASPMYKADVYEQSRNWTYLVAPNKFCAEVFQSCFLFDEDKMLKTGYPRNDILHLPEEETKALTEEIKKELNIPLDKKVVLYAPTWRDDQYYQKGQYKFDLQLDIKKMREKLGDEYVLLLRTHYFIADAIDYEQFGGFCINGAAYNDIARLYLISDILITDYSSVFFDYANLKRPMLFFTYDLEKYRGVLRGFYINVEEELPGPMLFDTDEVIDAIENVDEIEQKYKEKYDVFYDKYCGWEDGTSTKKIVEEVFAEGIK